MDPLTLALLGLGGLGGSLGGGIFPDESEFDIPSFPQTLGPASAQLGASSLLNLFRSAGGEAVTGSGKDVVPGTGTTFKQLFKSDKSKVVKTGKGTFALVPTTDDVLGQLSSFAQKQVDTQTAIGEKLAQSPFFRQSFANAQGDFDSLFRENVQSAFSKLGEEILGQSSLSADANVQATLLGPVAVQQEQFLAGIRQAEQGKVQGLVLGNPVASAANPLSLGQQNQAGLGAFGAASGVQQFNSLAQQGVAGAESGFRGGLFQNLLGGALQGIAGGVV